VERLILLHYKVLELPVSGALFEEISENLFQVVDYLFGCLEFDIVVRLISGLQVFLSCTRSTTKNICYPG
jgi:hypothetical protein